MAEVIYISSDDSSDLTYESFTDGSSDEITIEQQPEYRVVTKDDISKEMNSKLAQLLQIFTGLSRSKATEALSQCTWLVQEASEKLLGGFDQALPVTQVEGNDDCKLCYRSVSKNSLGLECGHKACFTCWNDYLSEIIMADNGMDSNEPTLGITCPGKCDFPVGDDFVMRVVDSEAVKQKYMRSVCEFFVRSNPIVKWCPAAGCEFALKKLNPATDVLQAAAVCVCSNAFCFGCGGKWHSPCDCDRLKRWLDECKTRDVLKKRFSQVKACPQCRAKVTKGGGFNWRTCSCGTYFCWLCEKPASQISRRHHACPLYSGLEDDILVDGGLRRGDGVSFWSKIHARFKEVMQKERELRFAVSSERFDFYFDMYSGQERSLRMESDLAAESKRLADEISRKLRIPERYEFVVEAAKALCRCRQTLMYCYAFAYWLEPNSSRDVFEMNQAILRQHVDELGVFLRKELDSPALEISIKDKTVGMTRFCLQTRENLQNHVVSGTKSGEWLFKN